jgi:hypothetical protein
MTIRILRETIRSLILEGRSYYRAGEGNGLIVLDDISDPGGFIKSPNRLYIAFRNADWLDDPKIKSLMRYSPVANCGQIAQLLEQDILGVCFLERGIEGVAYGASQVKVSAAHPGYGPALYDMVMSMEPNGIYPDRGDVSGPAYEMYKFYSLRRMDVEKKKLDDIEMKYTPDTIDDVPRSSQGFYLDQYGYDEPGSKNHNVWGWDRTNWVYNMGPVPGSDQILANGDEILYRIKDILGHSKSKTFLTHLADKYFAIRQVDDE